MVVVWRVVARGARCSCSCHSGGVVLRRCVGGGVIVVGADRSRCTAPRDEVVGTLTSGASGAGGGVLTLRPPSLARADTGDAEISPRTGFAVSSALRRFPDDSRTASVLVRSSCSWRILRPCVSMRPRSSVFTGVKRSGCVRLCMASERRRPMMAPEGASGFPPRRACSAMVRGGRMGAFSR